MLKSYYREYQQEYRSDLKFIHNAQKQEGKKGKKEKREKITYQHSLSNCPNPFWSNR